MYEIVKNALLILRAINNKVNQQIIELIRANGKLTVTQIYTGLRLIQSVASVRLKALKKHGILTSKREGKFTYYSLNHDRLDVIQCMSNAIVKNIRIVTANIKEAEEVDV